MFQLLGIYGASGFGRETLPMVRAAWGGSVDTRLVFIDDAPPAGAVNGHDVLSWQDFVAEPARTRGVILAIADTRTRETLARRCDAAGIAIASARAGNVVVYDAVEIGEGAILSAFVTLTSNIRIGRCFHANLYSYVAHDCTIGDFVTFAPGVKCNGNVVIEDGAYIGAGAVLRQGRPGRPLVIGKHAVVGMGAVVTRDVPAGATVAGTPARPLCRG